MNATLLHEFQYVTNSSNLKMLLVAKFFTSSTSTWLQNPKVQKMQQLLTKRIRHQVTFCMCSPCIIAFKISLIYVQGCEKRSPTYTCQLRPKIKFGNSDFVDLDRFNFYRASFLNLDRYCFCRGICQVLMNSFSSLVPWSNLHGFNT